MEQTDPHRRRRNPYRIRSPRIWALVRMRYLRGESAPRLAEAFGVTEYAIRRRIAREGWSKRALAEAEAACMPEPEEVEAELEAAEAAGEAEDWQVDPMAAARAALGRAARLMRKGEVAGAAAAARVADVMARAAARLEGDGGAGEEPDEQAFEAVRRKVLGLNPPPQGEGDREAVEGASGARGGGERPLGAVEPRGGVEGDGDCTVLPPPPPCGRSPSPCGGGWSE